MSKPINVLREINAFNIKYIQWTLQQKSSYSPIEIVSQSFSFQDRECQLELLLGSWIGLSESEVESNILYFKSIGKPQSSVKISVHGAFAQSISFISQVKTAEELSFNLNSVKQEIWYCEVHCLSNYMLIFDVIIYPGTSKVDKSIQTPSYIDKCILLDDVSCDFSKLLEEDVNHDVEFTCGDQTIKAHKNVLCCRSDVFASMLQTDMVEGQTGRVNIVDMDPTIFQQLVKCLYTGILPKLTLSNALQFYSAGDKYNIGTLKKQCAEFLFDNLSPENACDILIVADRHSDTDFKKSIIDYMMEEKIPYVGDKWTDFCKENPVLATEVLNLFCQHLRSK